MLLRLINNVTKRVTELEVTAEIKGKYAYVDITLPKMDAGEYEYELIATSGTIGRGLAQIGEIKTNADQYNNEVKYVQYNG